jgi:hypothetical protein
MPFVLSPKKENNPQRMVTPCPNCLPPPLNGLTLGTEFVTYEPFGGQTIPKP